MATAQLHQAIRLKLIENLGHGLAQRADAVADLLMRDAQLTRSLRMPISLRLLGVQAQQQRRDPRRDATIGQLFQPRLGERQTMAQHFDHP